MQGVLTAPLLLLSMTILLCRGSSPPPPDSLGCVSLFLDLLNALLSCQISGLVAKSLSEGVSREVVTVMLPKPLLKTILITSNGDNLLNQLKEELQVCVCVCGLNLFIVPLIPTSPTSVGYPSA